MSTVGNWINGLAFAVLLLGAFGSAFVLGGTTAEGNFVVRSSMLVAFMLAGIGQVFAGGWRWPKVWVGIPLAVYLLTVGISAWQIPSYTSWQEGMNIASYALAFLLAVQLTRSHNHLRGVITALAVATLVMGGYGVMQIFGVQYLPRIEAGNIHKISSFYYNQAHYGGWLVLLIPLVWSLFLYSRVWYGGLLWLALFGLLGINLLFTSSWDAFPAALVGVLLVTLLWGIQRRKWVMLGLMATAVLWSGLGAYWAFTKAPQQVEQVLGTSPQKLASYLPYVIRTRLAIHQTAWKTAKASKWMGVGLGQYTQYATLYRPKSAEASPSTHKFINYAHNDYLQVLAELGMVGLWGWMGLWMLVVLLRSSLPPALNLGIAAGIVALLIHGLTDGNFTVIPGTVVLAWFLGGLRMGHLAEPSQNPEAGRNLLRDSSQIEA